MSSRRMRVKTIGVTLLLLLGVYLFFSVTGAVAQEANPEVTITNVADLQRLSWGAILAGAILAIIIQLGLNLLGISVGMTTINPEFGEDSPEPKAIATGAAVWIVVSALISLFVGGWVAARFAGIPDNVDGLLHGLITWAVVMLITLFLLTTTVGRILSGISTMISQGLNLAGQAAGAVAQGAGNVARGVAQGAAQVTQDAARTAQRAAESAASTAQDTLENSPEVQRATQQLDLSRESIEREARNLMQQVGVSPEQVGSAVEQSAREIQRAAGVAARHPEHADDIFMTTLQRILDRGQNMVDQTDRDAVIRAIGERAGVSEEQAQETLSRWENTYSNARMELENVRRQAESKMQELGDEVRQRVDDVRQQVDQTRYQVERTAREAAAETTKAISRIAATVFAALVIGAIAAGIGGLIGAPEVLPDAEVDTTAQLAP